MGQSVSSGSRILKLRNWAHGLTAAVVAVFGGDAWNILYHIWDLVGGAITILKNMSSSMGRIIPSMKWKIKNVWNHLPDIISYYYTILYHPKRASAKQHSIQIQCLAFFPTNLTKDWPVRPCQMEETHVRNHHPVNQYLSFLCSKWLGVGQIRVYGHII